MASVVERTAGLRFNWTQIGFGNYIARPKETPGFTLAVDRVGHNRWRWWIERLGGQLLDPRTAGKELTAVRAKVICEERFREVFESKMIEPADPTAGADADDTKDRWRRMLDGSGLAEPVGVSVR